MSSVELSDGLAAFNTPWVAGNRDDVVEDEVFGQQVEEVPTIRNAVEALLNDAKERVERLEVVEVLDRRRHDGPRLSPSQRGSPGEVRELDRLRPSGLPILDLAHGDIDDHLAELVCVARALLARFLGDALSI